MDCLQCQAQNPGDAVFCENCGSRLEVACANCGGANWLGAKFCKKCGQRLLEDAPASPVTAGKFGSVETYTPKHLAEKILASKSSLEGERKQVTVLFADMKGSMELLADRDPEEARKLLGPVIEHMMEAVHRYEGTVSNSAEALPLLEEAAKRPSLGVGIGYHLCWLSEAYLHAGRGDEAIEVGQRALDRARKSKERGQEAWALRLLGEISSHGAAPEAEKAEEHYRRAMTLAEALGMRPLIAHCHVGLGKLYRHSGDLQQAKEHLNTATTMFREMEMEFWLEKAKTELKELQ